MTRTLLLVALVGCGPETPPIGDSGTSGTSSSDTGGTSGVSLDTLRSASTRLMEAICRKREECGCAETGPGSECADFYDSFYGEFVDAIWEGPGTFDADCLEERIAAIDALACDETEAFPMDWETRACPISDRVTSDADCRTPLLGVWQCEASQLCDQGGCFAPECEAVGTVCEDAATVLNRGLGEPCAFPIWTEEPICGEGLVCALDSTCQVGVPLGDACPAGDPGTPCANGYCACTDALPCESPSVGTCVPFLTVGSDCVDDEQCRPGWCEVDFDSDPPMGTCRPPVPLICDERALRSF
jgi:hypothetical protein